MKILPTLIRLLPVFILTVTVFAQPASITDWPYYYDWSTQTEFTVSGDGRTYVGGDGHWGTYTFVSYGSTFQQFYAGPGRAFQCGHGATVGNDTLFAVVDARSRSFNGTEKFFFSAARETQSITAYGATDYVRLFVNNTLLKSVLIRDLSYVADSMSSIAAALPFTVGGSIFTVRIVVEDNSAWSTARISVDNISFPGAPLPVQLASFTGAVENGRVRLAWRTLSEVNNYGFYAEKRHAGTAEWATVDGSFIAGHGTTNLPHDYSCTDDAPAAATEYRLRQIDLDGTTHYTEPLRIDAPTGVREAAPARSALAENYPNPFNPSTTIKYALPEDSRVSLKVFSVTGREVATLVDGRQPAGHRSVEWDAAGLASGVYFYRLEAGGFTAVKRLVLIR